MKPHEPPGYPLFLNLVFALSGHSPTGEAALEGPRRVLARGVGTGAPSRGLSLQYLLSVNGHRQYWDVKRDVDAAAVGYVLDHPKWYLASVGEAIVDFVSPPLRFIPGDFNIVRQRFPAVWRALSASGVLLMLAGIAALFIRVPDAVKLGPAIFLVSAVGTSLLARTENRRYAAPIVPLVLTSGVAVLHAGSRRIRDRADP